MRARVRKAACVYEVPSQMAAVNCTALTRTADWKHIESGVARTPVLLGLHARACKRENFKRAHMFTQSKHTLIDKGTHARQLRPNRSAWTVRADKGSYHACASKLPRESAALSF